ncbi:MAG: hypothetical protein JNM07_08315, partial [Phycisphaerae bacterium]|nr:hypothetical protein [Phycisphaerae bacterium]
MTSLLESLESRQLMSTFMVNNLSGIGTGSLRDAIDSANAQLGADVIEFAPGLTGTIALGGTELQVTEDLAINGPGASLLTVSGSGLSRVFNFASGSSSISGLTISGGNAGSGGGIRGSASSSVILNGSTVANNSAILGGGISTEGP